jgi:hypothetical protein
MSAFLLKTEHGTTYAESSASMPKRVTGGCAASPLLYCPSNPVTRGQMAVFLTKTFGLK